MAEKYEQVLEALRRIDTEKLEQAGIAYKERSAWLAHAVIDVTARFAQAKQASDRGENRGGQKENLAEHARNALPKKGGRSRRRPPVRLEAVGEEEEQPADSSLAADVADTEAAPADEPKVDAKLEESRGCKAARGKKATKAAAVVLEAAKGMRATRSRRGAPSDNATQSFSEQFPSPPRARKGRGKAKKTKQLSQLPSPATDVPAEAALPGEDSGPVAGAADAGQAAMDRATSEADAEAPDDKGSSICVDDNAEGMSQVEQLDEAVPGVDQMLGLASEGAASAFESDLAAVSEADPQWDAHEECVATVPATEERPTASSHEPVQTSPGPQEQSATADTPGVQPSKPSQLCTQRKQQVTSTPHEPMGASPANTPLHTTAAQHQELAILIAASSLPARDSMAQLQPRASGTAADEPESAEQPSDEHQPTMSTSNVGGLEVATDTEAAAMPNAAEADACLSKVYVSEASGQAVEGGTEGVELRNSGGAQCNLLRPADEDGQEAPSATAGEGADASCGAMGKQEDPAQVSIEELRHAAKASPPLAGDLCTVGTEETVYYTQQDDDPAVGSGGAHELDLVQGTDAAPEGAEDEEVEEDSTAALGGSVVDLGHALPATDASQADEDAEVQTGMAKNLVSTIRSFLPAVTKSDVPAAGRKPPEVEALKAAQAARKREAAKEAERLKQKEALSRQKADRAKHTQNVKAKQEAAQRRAADEAKRREEALKKKEEEAASRRRAKEEAERREREEKQRKLEELHAKKRQEEARRKEERREEKIEVGKKRAVDADSKPAGKVAEVQDLEAKKAKLEPSAASQVPPVPMPAAPQHPSQSVPKQVAGPSSAAANAASQAADEACAAVNLASASSHVPAQPESIEIAPYRSDDETDEEEEEQMLPGWAQEPALRQQLVAQQRLDPDDIFQQHQKTCSLDEVFDHASSGRDPKKDFSRRSSSGNWLEDRVTWKEELNYKKAMGYL